MTTSSEEINNIHEKDIIDNEHYEHENENNEVKNIRKRNPRQCLAPGCNKCSQGSTKFCIAHGGGRRCTYPGCYKAARDKQFCAGHGGGRRCTHQDCKKAAVGGSFFCTSHGGGKKCSVPGCEKSAQSPTQFCVRHGGGKTCKHEGCKKVARGRSEFCAGHGGGSNCRYPDCSNVAVSNHIFCREHRRQLKKSGLTVLKQGKTYYLSSSNSKTPLLPCEDLIHYVGSLARPDFQIHQFFNNLGYSSHDSSLNLNQSFYSTSCNLNNNHTINSINNANSNTNINSINNNTLNTLNSIPTHTQSVLYPTMSSTALFYPTSLSTISSLPIIGLQDSPNKSDDHEGNHSDSGTDTISNSGSDCSVPVGTSYSYLTSTVSPTSSVSSGVSSSIDEPRSLSGFSSSYNLNSNSKILYEFLLPFQCYPVYQSKFDPTLSSHIQTNIMSTATIPIVLSSTLSSELLNSSVSSQQQQQQFIGTTNNSLPMPISMNSNKRSRDEFELSNCVSFSSPSGSLPSNLSFYSAKANCI